MEMLEMGGNCKPLITFVHADTGTFREVVQRLTGAGPYQTHTHNEKSNPATSISSRKPTAASSMSKLHERRQYIKPKLDIVKPTIINSHFKSSSPLVSPSTIFSKLSIAEQESRGSPAAAAKPTVRAYEHEDENRNSHLEEEKAIQEKKFYLHPSPRRGRSPRTQPELLTLFPLTSPKSELQNP
ncbi:VQ motif-containing protein 31 [Argentina anserina]|uniref:VQ motif-containing protein 31 n=1 Tax=Argentina anserina TaxID=57926 RepID=UPI00217637F9|nr:VQ motif-containing protein 31 [Potentilla anserina]